MLVSSLLTAARMAKGVSVFLINIDKITLDRRDG